MVQDIARIAWTCVKECKDHEHPPVMCVKHQLEAEELLAPLMAYAQHGPDCPRSLPNLVLDLGPGWTQSKSYTKPCNCGLAAFISKAR